MQSESWRRRWARWRAERRASIDPAVRRARRIIILVVGCSVLAVGAALLVLPGPGVLVLAIGLSILATEFAWARWLLRKARSQLGDLGQRLGVGSREKRRPLDQEGSSRTG